MRQSYNFSRVTNTEQLRRPFNYTDDAQTTTAMINNRIGFECEEGNPVDVIIDTVSEQLEKVVEYTNAFSSSCLEIYQKDSTAQSGYYKLLLSNGSLTEVYCDMVGTDCEDLAGWTRVGYFNMAEGGSCPSPLVPRKYDALNYEICQRASFYSGCDSFFYDNLGIEYQSVCGRALGYQFGSPDALGWSWESIDSTYVDGMSITYDSPRKHIWTFVAGVNEDGNNFYSCPCNTGNNHAPPSFIEGHYYCESGLGPGLGWTNTLYADDKLWDGKQCNDIEEGCCSPSSGLPWFSRLLEEPTTSQVEYRLCDDEDENNERVPIELIEVFIR